MSVAQATVEKRWIHRDNVRAWAATGITVPVSVAIYLGIVVVTDRIPGTLTSSFIAWDVFGVIYAVMTLSAFRSVNPNDLPVLLRREGAQRTRWKRYLLGGGDGPGTAVTLSVVALGGAALLPRLDALTSPANEILLAGTLIVAVVMSWFVVVLSYAVHYARKHSEHPWVAVSRRGTARVYRLLLLLADRGHHVRHHRRHGDDDPHASNRRRPLGSDVLVQHDHHRIAGDRLDALSCRTVDYVGRPTANVSPSTVYRPVKRRACSV